MPDINKAYILSPEYKKRLKDKFTTAGIDYKNWNDDDIIDIRANIRDFYRKEQNGKCSYCQRDISLVSASNCQVEHIVPKSSYAEFMFEPLNLCTICADCNEIKRNQEVLNEIPEVTVRTNIKKYPKTSGAFKIIHPHFDCFEKHIFEVNGYYLDLTKKGGYTILYCNLNRKLHKLGYDDTLVNFNELKEIMTKFLSEKDFLKQVNIIKKIKKLLMLV